jgi:hypothetical protein
MTDYESSNYYRSHGMDSESRKYKLTVRLNHNSEFETEARKIIKREVPRGQFVVVKIFRGRVGAIA